MSKNDGTGDFEVGYGKPPKQTRFRKGKSGNPKGRPKGRKNLSTMVADALNTKVAVTENGSKRKLPLGEALIKQMSGEAFNGSMSDKVKFLSFVERYSPDAPLPAEYHTERFIRFIESDGNGRPANPEDLEDIKDFSNLRIVDRPSDLSDSDEADADELDPDSFEAVWKASGIDDDEI